MLRPHEMASNGPAYKAQLCISKRPHHDKRTQSQSQNRQHPIVYTRKNAQVVTSLQTSCNKSVHKLSTSCVRTACS